MKNYKTLYKVLLSSLLISITVKASAQTGISRQTAFELGSFYPGAIFTNIQDNTTGFGGFDQPFPNGIFYNFTLSSPTVVTISQSIISLKP